MTANQPSVVIVGAGPAGITLCLLLAKSKIPHLLLEQSKFPKDKVCSGVITAESRKVLKQISPELLKEFESASWAYPTNYMHFHEGKHALKFNFSNDDGTSPALCYTAKRIEFDTWLHSKLDQKYTTFIPESKVIKVQKVNNGVSVETLKNGETAQINASLIVGADGQHSVVRKFLHPKQNILNPPHHCSALRQIWKNVSVPKDKPLELITLGGPFLLGAYVFYYGNNEAVVGIGTLTSTVQKHNVNLRHELESFCASQVKKGGRLEGATAAEPARGWGIPLNTDAKNYAGDNYLLIGDAARFGDRAFAKGIGYAMLAAASAAKTIAKSIEQNKYDLETVKEYEIEIEKRFRSEWVTLERLEKISQFKIVRYLIIYIGNIKWVKRNIESQMVKKLVQYIS